MSTLANTHLYQEIHQQPDTLGQLLVKEKNTIQQLAAMIKERQVSHVVIAARGTSDNAGRYAQYLLGAINGLCVGLATPSLFTIYQQPPRLAGALVLGISQSGKGPDVVAVLTEARRQGALTAAITNFSDSPLGQAAEVVINLQAGVEQSLAATKTYTGQLLALGMLSAALAEDSEMEAALADIPETVAATLAMETDVSQIAERYRYMRDCVVIGRGYNYATAFELALKLKELTYTIAEPYSSADFLHGPLALIEDGFPALVVAPSGVMLPELQEFVRTLKEREAEVIIISDDVDTLAEARIPLALPRSVPEWLSPLTAIIPGQLLTMHLAQVRDYDPDHPRGLRKVTQTR
jgi:glucosamine--fructose-6-phosphate aminotransferase (isomerizing)